MSIEFPVFTSLFVTCKNGRYSVEIILAKGNMIGIVKVNCMQFLFKHVFVLVLRPYFLCLIFSTPMGQLSRKIWLLAVSKNCISCLTKVYRGSGVWTKYK